jgi:hypothetical protein
LVHEEGIFEVEAINSLSIPHSNKTTLAQIPQIVPKETKLYYTNCHWKNHNVEPCRVKRKENFVLVVFEVTTQHIKV